MFDILEEKWDNMSSKNKKLVYLLIFVLLIYLFYIYGDKFINFLCNKESGVLTKASGMLHHSHTSTQCNVV